MIQGVNIPQTEKKVKKNRAGNPIFKLTPRLISEVVKWQRTRDRRLIAYALTLGGNVEDIAKIIDPDGPVTKQGLYLQHPGPAIEKERKSIERILKTV